MAENIAFSKRNGASSVPANVPAGISPAGASAGVGVGAASAGAEATGGTGTDVGTFLSNVDAESSPATAT